MCHQVRPCEGLSTLTTPVHREASLLVCPCVPHQVRTSGAGLSTHNSLVRLTSGVCPCMSHQVVEVVGQTEGLSTHTALARLLSRVCLCMRHQIRPCTEGLSTHVAPVRLLSSVRPCMHHQGRPSTEGPFHTHYTGEASLRCVSLCASPVEI